MRNIRIEKLTLNVGCGDNKQKIEKAKKLLEMLTGNNSVVTVSKTRSTFGVAQGRPIGVKTTLRKKQAEEFLKQVVQAASNKVRASQMDKDGNFSIGVRDYIDLPGIKYSHDVGMLGFGVAVTLERAGFHAKKRRIQKRNIPKNHKINKEEVQTWLKQKFGVEIV